MTHGNHVSHHNVEINLVGGKEISLVEEKNITKNKRKREKRKKKKINERKRRRKGGGPTALPQFSSD